MPQASNRSNKMKNVLCCFFIGILSSSAFALKMPGLPGGGADDAKEAESTGISAADAQEAIVSDFKTAYRLVIEAQGHVAEALGLKEDAEKRRTDAARISGDDCAASCMKEIAEASPKAMETIQEAMDASSTLDDNSKAILSQAYTPLVKGTLKMAQLAPKAKDWAKSASAEIKEAGLRGAGKMKKKFASGLYIAKTTPKIMKEWGETTSQIVSFGKKVGVSTDGAAGTEMEG
jgi:hypothetical protein